MIIFSLLKMCFITVGRKYKQKVNFNITARNISHSSPAQPQSVFIDMQRCCGLSVDGFSEL